MSIKNNNSKQLTKIQQQVYDYIVKYISENGYAPSYREISNNCSCGTTKVFEVIDRLNYKGFIISKRTSPCAIKVVGYKFVKDKQ